MGTAKALLPLGPELMLQRVVRLVNTIVAAENMVVVAAAGQVLPLLPHGVQLARDARENRGPLEGLAAGLQTLSQRVDLVYATSCDMPLLVPAFIEQMFQLLAGHEIAVPRDEKFHHPLAAVYRISVLPHVQQLLATDRLRPNFLFQECDTLEVPVKQLREQLREVDPDLATLENINHPNDYQRALQTLGFCPF